MSTVNEKLAVNLFRFINQTFCCSKANEYGETTCTRQNVALWIFRENVLRGAQEEIPEWERTGDRDIQEVLREMEGEEEVFIIEERLFL